MVELTIKKLKPKIWVDMNIALRRREKILKSEIVGSVSPLNQLMCLL